MVDIGEWLEQNGLGELTQTLVREQVDVETLPELTDADLKDIGLALGPRKKLLKAIRALVEHGTASSDGSQPPAVSAPGCVAGSAEAERRQLTVMFCDLVGSVALGERMDVEDYRDVLARFRAAAVKAIEDNGGFIARHQGDGLLVYFGYPRAREDDAERAARAGLQLIDAVQRMAGPAETRLQVRVGIATGQTVVGDRLATGGAYELGALGRTPNLAARLQAEAPPDSVLVSDATAELIQGRFALESLEPRTLKGFEEPLSPYKVLRERRDATRFDARAVVQLSDFVGREDELDFLTRRWQQAAAGRGQLLLVIGDPGIGKSRLSGEFLQTLRSQVHRTMLLQCSPNLIDSALHPVVSYLNLTLDGIDSTGERRLERLKAWVLEEVDEEPESIMFLADLLSLPVEKGSDLSTSLEAGQRRERTLATFVRHIETVARGAPLVLLIEDVHWADPSTREMLGLVVDAIQGLQVLAIVTSRPGFGADWTDSSHVRLLNLARLATEESECLARSAAKAPTALPAAVVQEIVARGGGNPLFIEEIVRNVVRRPQAPGAMPPVPLTLQDSLMGRLDGLEFGKPVAQSASVIGREFSYRLLRDVWDDGLDALERGLSELAVDGVILQRASDEERLFQFKHALVRDTAYASLLRERRQAIHRRVATTLQAHQPDVVMVHPELLARHLAAANDLPKARDMWNAASVRAAERGSHEEVLEHCQNALALIDMDRLDRDTAHKSIDVLLRLAHSQRVLDRIEEALASLHRAESLLVSMDQSVPHQARIHYMRGNLNFTLGRTDECEAEHLLALELARAAGDREIELGALSGLGDAAYAKGRMISAERLFNGMLVTCDEYGLPEGRSANLSMRADARTYSGRLLEGLADAEEGYALARANDDMRALVLCCCAGLVAFYESGRFAEVVQWAGEGVEAARALGSLNLESFVLGFHVRVLVATGAASSARPLAQIAVEQATRGEPAFAGAMALSAAALAEPSPSASSRLLARGEAILEQKCVSHNLFWFCIDAIEISLRNDRWSEARRYADLLEVGTGDEPLPWTDLHIESGRVLARFGAGERTDSLGSSLRDLELRAGAAHCERLREALQPALSRFDGGTRSHQPRFES